MSLVQRAALGALRTYKRWLSPLLPASCRYVPTCSEYAEQAIAHHGIFRGAALAGARLFRCHPIAAGGLDPVPLKKIHSHIHPYSRNEQTL